MVIKATEVRRPKCTVDCKGQSVTMAKRSSRRKGSDGEICTKLESTSQDLNQSDTVSRTGSERSGHVVWVGWIPSQSWNENSAELGGAGAGVAGDCELGRTREGWLRRIGRGGRAWKESGQD